MASILETLKEGLSEMKDIFKLPPITKIKRLIEEKEMLLQNLYSEKTATKKIFPFGTHYSYLGMWGMQFLFWFFSFGTLFIGGVIWAIYDVIRMEKLVAKGNEKFLAQIQEIDNQIQEIEDLMDEYDLSEISE